MTRRATKQPKRTWCAEHPIYRIPNQAPTSGWDLRDFPYGVARRAKILARIKEGGCLWVNGKHVLQIWQDPDLRYLLKRGLIKQCRETLGVRKNKQFAKAGKRSTYLVLA